MTSRADWGRASAASALTRVVALRPKVDWVSELGCLKVHVVTPVTVGAQHRGITHAVGVGYSRSWMSGEGTYHVGKRGRRLRGTARGLSGRS